MALVRRFFSRRIGENGEETFSLARDQITDEVFVLRSASSGQGDVETTISLSDFLKTSGAPQADLCALIGTLVTEE